MKCYCKNYPRPQLVRKTWTSLDGAWDFCFDDSRKGLAEAWFKGFQKSHTIEVPFTYETKLSGIQDESPHDCVWYQKKITHQCSGKRTLLHFEGVDYHCHVWVNGLKIGEHQGAYARFSFDITEALVDGENLISVMVQDSLSPEQPRGKQRTLKNNYGCWYVQTTGIWKSVWLEEVSSFYVQRLKLTPDINRGFLELEYELNEEPAYNATYDSASNTGDLSLEVVASFKGIEIVRLVQSVSVHKSLSLNLKSSLAPASGLFLWWPGNPQLYDLEIRLLKNGEVIDELLSYFGLRKVSTENAQFLLNEQPYYQRLILDQGYWPDSHLTPPSEDALIEDIDKIKQLGYNGVRKHMKLEDERFLYWADVKGLLVWSEMAGTYAFSDKAVTNFTKEWMEVVAQNYNHPSIVVWTPFNESWGVPNIKTCSQEQSFTMSIYYLTKAFDKMRPVITNDGWEHTISDILTLHDYVESGEDFIRIFKDKEAIINNRMPVAGCKYAFADGFQYKNQPIIISEFGGIAFQSESGWGYGNKVKDEEDFIRRFERITGAIKSLGYICGYCYTQVSDVQQEINGLMDEPRAIKVDADKIREINLRK